MENKDTSSGVEHLLDRGAGGRSGSIFVHIIRAYLATNMFLDTISHSRTAYMVYFFFPVAGTLFAISPQNLLLPVDWYQQHGCNE